MKLRRFALGALTISCTGSVRAAPTKSYSTAHSISQSTSYSTSYSISHTLTGTKSCSLTPTTTTVDIVPPETSISTSTVTSITLSETSAFTLIPYADGRLFNIDGKSQYFAGTNTWWLSYLSEDADVKTALSEIAATHLRVTRVWAFGNVNAPVQNDWQVYFQILNETLSPNGSLINYNSKGIARLDSAVSHAEKYGIRLILPMLNNWDTLGGINAYTTAFGGNATSFYTDAKSQRAYRNYISFIVERYKSSPAIFAWELCNECRCSDCPSSTITNWASSTSAFIKSIDPHHMVSLGDEGWFFPSAEGGDGSYAYSGAEGVDFIENLKIPTIDYGTFHMYPDQWGYDPSSSWGSTWIEQHDAVGRALGKPVVLEEYGSTDSKGRVAIMKSWQDTVVENTSVAYDSFWQFGTVLPSGVGVFDDYAIYYNTSVGSDYRILAVEHARDMFRKKGRKEGTSN